MDEEKFDVVIEVGHKATLKEKVDSNGNTHKWNAFVRSGDPSNQQKLDLIVKKVVFNLHETFKNPTRPCYTQPYCVKESGYGQFEFPIDIYFNGIDTKYSINYYLELPSLNCTTPLSRVRKEKITFINPCPEFRRVLVEGGGILHKTRCEHPTDKMSMTNEIIDNKADSSDFLTNTPKLNMSNSSNNLSLSSSSSSSFSSSPPSSNSSLTTTKKPSLKNKLSSFTLNSNQNQSNQKLSNSNHNSSLLKSSNTNSNPNSSINTSSNNEASLIKTNKKNNLNRSKGKSTVLSQTVSPQTARSMSISPSPKEKAKSSSPNNDARLKLSPHLKLCSPQTISSNIHDPAISPRHSNNYFYNELSFNDTHNANATDGSFLEVENEIEIKTEVDIVDINNSLNYQKNNKKRPLNTNESVQMSSLLDSSSSTPSLTGFINNLNGSAKGLNNEYQTEESSTKKKRFRSQENGPFDDDLSFTNENNKPGKKFNESLNGEGKKLKKNHSNSDLKNGAPLSKAPSNNKLKENERASSIGNSMQATTNDTNNNYIESSKKGSKLTNGELKATNTEKLNKNKRMKRIKSEHYIEANGMRNSPIDHESSLLTNGQKSMLENGSHVPEITDLNNGTNISLSPQFSSLMTPPPSLTSSHSNTNGNNGTSHLNGRRSVSPYTIQMKQSSTNEGLENNSNDTSKQLSSKPGKISKNLTSKSPSQSPVPSSDHALNKNESNKKHSKLKSSEQTQSLPNNNNSIKKSSTQNKESSENPKPAKKIDSSSSSKTTSPNLKSDSTSKKQNDSSSREKSSEKTSSLSHRSSEKNSEKKYDITDRKLPSSHDRRSMENGFGKHSHMNGSGNSSGSSSSGSNNRYHTSHNNLGSSSNDNYQNNSPANSSATLNGSRSTSSHKDNQKNPTDSDKDSHHHRSHSSHRHSSHDNSRRHSSTSSSNNHSHHRSSDRDLKESRFSSSSSSSRRNSSTSNRISSDRKSSEKSSSKSRSHDTSSDSMRQKNSSSSNSNLSRVSGSASEQIHLKKEEVIEDLNRKLRRGKMDEENMKIDDDNCSHASTLSTMSNSSSSSSILSNKVNNHTNEKYEKKNNLKNEPTNKSKNNWDQKNHVTNTHNSHNSPARLTKENTLNGDAPKISKDRMLKIFERINQIFSSKQYDLLAKICTIVMPFGFTDSRAFRFDLFALETNVVEKLESLLLNESLYDTFNSMKSNHNNTNNVPNSTSSHKSISSVYNNSSSNLKATNSNHTASLTHNNVNSHSTEAISKKSSKTSVNNNSTPQNMINNSNNNNNVNNNFTTKTKELKTNIIK